jgi:hypothetical protein
VETKRAAWSVLAFDPTRIKVNDADLAPRAVGTARVHVGTVRGYSVAVVERGGVAYAIASDMDSERNTQLAANGVSRRTAVTRTTPPG